MNQVNPNMARALRRVSTQDGLQTFDRQTIDSAGAFLIGELERLDQKLHMPLATVTWSRDIQLRSDVSIADETSSFTNSSFASAGGPSPNGKSWIGKDATAIAGMSLDIAKTAQPLPLWGMELGWTLPELESAMKVGRPVDQQKFAGMNLKYQMDIDEQVYVGDPILNVTGMMNNAQVSVANAPTGSWTAATAPGLILGDVNELLTRVWTNTAFARCPRKLALHPIAFGLISSMVVSNAGNISVLEYVKNNCISNAENGIPLEIVSSKWLTGRGVGATNRMMAYTNDEDLVRFPLVPLQRTPLEYRGLRQLTTYFGRLGVVEVVYEETLGYSDGI